MSKSHTSESENLIGNGRWLFMRLRGQVEKAKSLVTAAPVLSFYDPGKELVLENDASEYGIGSALFQDGKPIAFASRTLTGAETRYAQIKKEMLAVCYGLTKFLQYTFGHDVNIITDHKPLVLC